MIASTPRRIDLNHARHAILSPAEEAAVVTIMRRGGPASEAARARLVNANLKFVVSVARNFITCGVPMEDLINEGAAGLVRATHSYEPTQGKFISYAVWWVRQSIVKHLHDHAHTIRVPSPHVLKTKMRTAEENARRRRRTRETPEQAQAEIDGINRLRQIQSVDELVLLGWEPADEDTDPAAGIERRDHARRANRALAALPARSREVVRTYYGFGSGETLTLDEVGERFNLTRERVRQIKEKAMLLMRRAAERGHV